MAGESHGNRLQNNNTSNNRRANIVVANGNGSFRSYSRSDPGSFQSYSLSVRSFRRPAKFQKWIGV